MARTGRPRKWPLDRLKVGESLILPWLNDAKGQRRLNQKVLHVMVWRAARRTGFRLLWAGDHPGLRVTRIA
jgi:hypothetical protein